MGGVSTAAPVAAVGLAAARPSSDPRDPPSGGPIASQPAYAACLGRNREQTAGANRGATGVATEPLGWSGPQMRNCADGEWTAPLSNNG